MSRIATRKSKKKNSDSRCTDCYEKMQKKKKIGKSRIARLENPLTVDWLSYVVASVSGVTILLSLTVFLNLVAETLPQVSDAIPLLGRLAALACATPICLLCSGGGFFSFERFVFCCDFFVWAFL